MERELKPENNGRTCSGCKYFSMWTDLQTKQQATICRRNAPSVTSMAFPVPKPQEAGGGMGILWQHSTFWPMVNASDWCGEWVGNARLNS